MKQGLVKKGKSASRKKAKLNHKFFGDLDDIPHDGLLNTKVIEGSLYADEDEVRVHELNLTALKQKKAELEKLILNEELIIEESKASPIKRNQQGKSYHFWDKF